MRAAEEDVPIVSPGGTYSAAVCSAEHGGLGHTQVIVECPSSGGGSGVFVLPLPHVPLRVWWESDARLVIAHPAEIQPRPGDDLAQRAEVGFAAPAALEELGRLMQGGVSGLDPAKLEQLARGAQATARVVTIRYEQYDGAGELIAELRRRADEAQPPAPAPNLLAGDQRGRLVAVGGEYAYDYYDAHEPDSLAPRLQALGYQGGGESWAGIVHGLLSLRAVAILPQIRLDPEADGLRVWSSSRAALTRVAELVTEAHGDPALLHEAIAAAEADAEME